MEDNITNEAASDEAILADYEKSMNEEIKAEQAEAKSKKPAAAGKADSFTYPEGYDPDSEGQETEGEDQEEIEGEDQEEIEGEDQEDGEAAEDESDRELTSVEIDTRDYHFQVKTNPLHAELNKIQQQLATGLDEATAAKWIESEISKGVSPAQVMFNLTKAMQNEHNEKQALISKSNAIINQLWEETQSEAVARYRGPDIDPDDFFKFVSDNQELVNAVRNKKGVMNPNFILDVVKLYNHMKTPNKKTKPNTPAKQERRSLATGKGSPGKVKPKNKDGWDDNLYKRFASE